MEAWDYSPRKASGEDLYSKLSVPRDVPVHGCRSRFVLSVEEEAAQDRPAASIVRGTTRYSVDFEEAMNPEGLYWSSGWLHNHFDLFRDRSARERQA